MSDLAECCKEFVRRIVMYLIQSRAVWSLLVEMQCVWLT